MITSSPLNEPIPPGRGHRRAIFLAAMLHAAAATPSAAAARTVAEKAAGHQSDRQAVVEAIVRIIQTEFAYPDKRQRVIARLKQGLAAGRYDTDDHSFAARVTEDLLSASGDKHLYLVYDPAKQVALSNSPLPAEDAITASTGILAERFKRENQGLIEQKILPGNVRYLNITAFDWTIDVTGAVYDDALRFLRGGDAIVIDLRENAGGVPDAVRYLLSYFVAPRELLATFYRGATATEFRALDRVPGGQIVGKPLYVLTSDTTASAAEEFAYYVFNHHIGEVVGEKTAGAGNIKDDFPVAPGFVLSASVARSVDPFTRGNWEGVGITPNVATPASSALAAAHVRALERISQSATGPIKLELALDLRLARARWHLPKISSDDLARYAGIYGDRRVWVAQNVMHWQRGDQPELLMEPLGADWFLLGDSGNQAHFQIAGGHAIALTISRRDGDSPTIVRTGPE